MGFSVILLEDAEMNVFSGLPLVGRIHDVSSAVSGDVTLIDFGFFLGRVKLPFLMLCYFMVFSLGSRRGMGRGRGLMLGLVENVRREM